MHRPASAHRPASCWPEPYADDGPQWVVARAEAEIVARYGFLDDGELGLTAAMFDPPTGAFLVARRAGAAGPPVGGVGVRAVARAAGEIRRLWVDLLARAGVARPSWTRSRTRPCELGLTALRLGTGDRQPEAVALYESSGWERVLVERRRPPGARSPHLVHRDADPGRDTDARSSSICEIEPATTPDLTRVRHQIGVLSPVATTFLIPDNHIGRATVSSVAVAHEVQQMGGRSIACLNARDRNLLGFRRDLLTAAAYGVDQFLFVYGDEPLAGARTSELTVRTMLTEGRAVRGEGCGRQAGRPHALRRGDRAAAAAGVEAGGRLPLRADRLLPRRPAGLAGQRRHRRRVPVYAGVHRGASAAMARNLEPSRA